MDRRRAIGAGGIGAAAAVMAAAIAALAGGGGSAGGASSAVASTAPLERRDLAESVSVDGYLGFDDSASVVDRLPGTVTWLPPVGAGIERGGRLLEIDDEPVVLMYGRLPAYRPLALGRSGRDVRQLKSNLAALGFDAGGAMEVDGRYDAATAIAVADWQESLKVKATGEVELGRVVFQRGPRRVASLEAGMGDTASGGPAEPASLPALTTTSTRRMVTVQLDPEQVSEARVGEPATVGLPGGEDVRGRIASVGKVAAAPASDSASGASGGDSGSGEADPGDATIEATISLPRGRAGSRLDEAPVDVALQGRVHKDVFAVPVGALLGTGGGGYAIRVADGSDVRLLEVEPGTFADGYVEIEGEGLREGMRVEVPEE